MSSGGPKRVPPQSSARKQGRLHYTIRFPIDDNVNVTTQHSQGIVITMIITFLADGPTFR